MNSNALKRTDYWQTFGKHSAGAEICPTSRPPDSQRDRRIASRNFLIEVPETSRVSIWRLFQCNTSFRVANLRSAIDLSWNLPFGSRFAPIEGSTAANPPLSTRASAWRKLVDSTAGRHGIPTDSKYLESTP